eukprot:15866167-Heterocapsa_arctica.AAC.1
MEFLVLTRSACARRTFASDHSRPERRSAISTCQAATLSSRVRPSIGRETSGSSLSPAFRLRPALLAGGVTFSAWASAVPTCSASSFA